MKINPKSQKGAVTLIVLVTMLFLTAFLMTLYLRLANKAATSAETTAEIAKRYNNIGDLNNIYGNLVVNPNENLIIPIKDKTQLAAIGSNTYKEVNGKMYYFSTTGNYVLQNDIDLEGVSNNNTTWWTPLPSTFTGVLDGLGYTITGLYINDNSADNQGLFGILNGTVRNVNIEDSYLAGDKYVGAIAGKNFGLIENCTNKGTIIGTDYVGGITGINAIDDQDETIYGITTNCKNIGNIIGDTNVTGGFFAAVNDNNNTPVEVWSKTRTLSGNNYKFISENDVAVVPQGFKVSANIDEQTIKEGMVIQDSDGNEFVWVPVSYGTFTRTEWANNQPTNSISNDYKENKTTDLTLKYDEMVTSVETNGGFYIGRYEAGEKEDGKIVVKRDKKPYTNIKWGDSTTSVGTTGAVYLSQNMYVEDNYGVISTLCYGIQWDAILRFVIDNNHRIDNCKEWGNYKDSVWEIGRGAAQFFSSDNGEWKRILDETNRKKQKTSGETYKLTTGASDNFKAKNIFDLAGNSFEWTMEDGPNSYKVYRGGCYGSNGMGSPINVRGYTNPSNSSDIIGFRVAIYIK